MLSEERADIVAEKLLETQAIDGAIETCRSESERAANLGSDDLVRIYNLLIYVCLTERDKNLLCVDALRADESDRGRLSFVARQLATLLYEAAGDIRQKALTKPMRDTILAIDPNAVSVLNAANELATAFWNRRSQELKRWRNTASAHRDFDASVQLQAVQDIELSDIMTIAEEYTEVVRHIFSLLTNVIAKTATLGGAVTVVARANLNKPRP